MSETEGSAPLRVGVVGYGLAGTVFHAPLIASTPGMAVTAIVTADQARQARARRDFPQARVLVVRRAAGGRRAARSGGCRDPEPLPYTHRGRRAGGGIAGVMDKPVAPSVAEAERLGAAVERAGKILWSSRTGAGMATSSPCAG